MPELIDLKTFTDNRGNLTVIDKCIPFPIARIFYIYGVDDSVRGGHRHVETVQAAICIQGSCRIFTDNNQEQKWFDLNSPSTCLLLYPEDWHTMSEFSKDAILMVLASTSFDASDYIHTPYNKV
ncbi:sugar 3,4-ketoisomerase [Desertivirga brevis]|uniref:sugar 3,4-ketoisomerase n=1 Tax=Desertivirga brevis TaxID=2810310 RepID=UPI001A957D4D|nr:FdtA/QdtA family cupin domain-containing protein [Pedobacter sp. SYSU D00873]